MSGSCRPATSTLLSAEPFERGLAAEASVRWAAKVTIQDLGSIGEVVAAVATVATVAYLALQLRQNTRAVMHSSSVSSMQSWSESTLVIAGDAELNKLYWDGLADRSQLDEYDKHRFDGLMNTEIHNYQQVWSGYEQGMLDDASWPGMRDGLRWLTTNPGFADFWKEWRAMNDPEFARVVEEMMSEETPSQV